ncbi:ABC transporter permease family protein [Roseateles albus]|uniref:ABC3 transporter permease protein domain-containing protein n=1 Tax=Roseateles albus TaxID=2987525 RepID=A0ABT5KBI4_9BURK|nr:hypothetical protein [Roseateles albus]MDC8770131.1 hypothetical protein [Roseateles albus]
MDDIWSAHGPAIGPEIQSADEQLAEVNQQEQQISALLAGIALLAVGVAMLGAYALGLPLAAYLGWHYLSGFEARVDLASGLVLPLVLACAITLIVTVLAALRHLRQALSLQPIEALR